MRQVVPEILRNTVTVLNIITNYTRPCTCDHSPDNQRTDSLRRIASLIWFSYLFVFKALIARN